MDELAARVILSIYVTAADEKVGALVSEFGAVRTVEKLQAGECSKNLATRLRTANFKKDFSQVMKQTERSGSTLITPEHFCWPSNLTDLDFAMPFCLWIRGDLSALLQTKSAVAVVGARAATSYGERIAVELGSTLAEWGIATVSGGAFGIDAAAHRGSIAADGITIAVLASGIDIAYPAAHSGLFSRIIETGLIISEAPPGGLPLKNKFLTRNRIIAALSKEVVVVEAALRSGSLSTANWANVLGRKVWGIPGPITSPTSAGVHKGIRDKSMEIMLTPTELIG